MAIINGKETPEAEGMTVSGCLEANGYKAERVAVEINGSIIKKELYGTRIISAEDRVEIVSFVGGGSK